MISFVVEANMDFGQNKTSKHGRQAICRCPSFVNICLRTPEQWLPSRNFPSFTGDAALLHQMERYDISRGTIVNSIASSPSRIPSQRSHPSQDEPWIHSTLTRTPSSMATKTTTCEPFLPSSVELKCASDTSSQATASQPRRSTRRETTHVSRQCSCRHWLPTSIALSFQQRSRPRCKNLAAARN